MKLSPFYQRTIWLSLALFIAGLIVTYWPQSTPEVVAAGATPARAEARLAQLRDTAATVPAKEKIFKDAQADLAGREKGLIVADTAAQAQAQLIAIIREVGRRESPPVEIRGTEGFGIRAFGDAYGEAFVSVQLQCPIDQLVNMVSSLASRTELVSTTDLRVTSSNAKDKTVAVHLTVSGIVPRKLVPEKRTASSAGDRFVSPANSASSAGDRLSSPTNSASSAGDRFSSPADSARLSSPAMSAPRVLPALAASLHSTPHSRRPRA